MRTRKKYPYKGRMLTINELYELKECKVTLRELQVNIWKRKMCPEEAIVTPKEKRREKAAKKYFYHGLMLTFNELAELSQCKVTPWKLRVMLRRGVPIHLAIQGIDEIPEEVTEVPEKLKQERENRHKDNVNFIKNNCKSFSGSISFNEPKSDFNSTHQYNYIVCRDRFGLDINQDGLDLEKYVEKYNDVG